MHKIAYIYIVYVYIYILEDIRGIGSYILGSKSGHPVVVVDDSKEDDWMDHHVPSVLWAKDLAETMPCWPPINGLVAGKNLQEIKDFP